MTMKELAKLAGVSVSAVSRYLNDGPLSQDKKERIRKAIEETGYQRDVAAQMLRGKTTDYVGLIVPKLDSEAVTRVTRGASMVLAEAGYLCLLSDTGSESAKEVEFMKLFQERRVAGIIVMATSLTPAHHAFLTNTNIPVVFVGQRFPQIPCISHNDYGAAYDLTNLMIKKGRRHIGMIGVSDQDKAVGTNRRLGLRDALADAGIALDETLLELGDFTAESGYEAMERLLSSGHPIDGVLCATDRMAFGAMEAIRAHGLRIPEDISIAGMDDDWAGTHILPHLTTCHFYFRNSGEIAAKHLLEMMASREKEKAWPVMQTMLEYDIIERDSI